MKSQLNLAVFISSRFLFNAIVIRKIKTMDRANWWTVSSWEKKRIKW